ncbi:MAG: sigma-70 family RNA polymerase sigma factor [Kofleriaceae bacterium]
MDLEHLTKEMGWVRRLAGAIVKDDTLADDVAQEAWLVAQEHAPDDRPLRPWLHRVVVNLARMRGRSGTRRRVREQAIDVSEVTTPAELVERVTTQRAVAHEVLALDEPYRTVVLMFYVEGTPTRAIAERLQIPDGTVRRRLKVARDELRSKLAKAGVMGALVVLATTRKAAAATTAVGAVAMKKLIAILVVLVMLVGGGVAWWWSRGDRDTASGAVATSSSGLLGRPGANTTGASSVPSWLVQPGLGARRLAGHVMSAGVPVSGAIVRLGLGQRELATVTVGRDGAFDLGEQPPAVFSVSAEAAGVVPASLTVALADPTVVADKLVVELAPCRTRIHGHVLDASGGGVAKARVTSADLGGTDADDAGAYSLCISDDAWVRVDADGYGSLSVAFAFRGEIEHDFLLAPEDILTGHVVDEDDQPVAHARINAFPDRDESAAGQVTNADDGTFRIAGLVPGRYRLFAFAAGLGSVTPAIAHVMLGRSDRDVRILVTQRARVTGRVVMDGKPIAGVHLSCGSNAYAYSQPGGGFVVDNVRFGSASCATVPYRVVSPPFAVDRANVGGVVIEVAAAPTIRGRVTRHGRPVAGAVVSCHNGMRMSSDGARVVADVRSDASGDYALPVPPPPGAPPGHRMACDLDATAVDSERAGSRAVHLEIDRDLRADLELDAGASIAGTVVDDAGAPVANVCVVGTGATTDRAMTDASGQFELAALRGDADYRIAVFPTPAAQNAFEPIGARPTVHVAGDAPVTGVRIAIHHAVQTIRGVVVDDTGAHLPDVIVTASGWRTGARSGAASDTGPSVQRCFSLPQAVSDATGAFAITDLATGSYTLEAHAASGGEATLADVAAGGDVQIVVARAGTVDGELVGFPGTTYVRARNMTTNAVSAAAVDGDHFAIAGLPPARYAIEALGPDAQSQDGAGVDVATGSTTHVVLTSRQRGRIAGTVVDVATKQPVADLQCFSVLVFGGMRGTFTGQLQDDPPRYPSPGSFELGVFTGRNRAVCTAAGYAQAAIDVDVTAGAMARVALVSIKLVMPPSDPGFDVLAGQSPPIVVTLDPKGPAAAAGLAVGDRLVSVDGQSVAELSTQGVMAVAHNHRPGTTITLVVDRGVTSRTLRITLPK